VAVEERAIVEWSGLWPAQMTRKATSSWQRRSIWRAERTPIEYAYMKSATIILGSWAAAPQPSSR